MQKSLHSYKLIDNRFSIAARFCVLGKLNWSIIIQRTCTPLHIYDFHNKESFDRFSVNCRQKLFLRQSSMSIPKHAIEKSTIKKIIKERLVNHFFLLAKKILVMPVVLIFNLRLQKDYHINSLNFSTTKYFKPYNEM